MASSDDRDTNLYAAEVAEDENVSLRLQENLPLRQITVLIVLVLCRSIAVQIMNLPLNRLIESRYCLKYYQDHDPSSIPPDGNMQEHMCKFNIIQEQLAWLQGVTETIHLLCDLIMTLPFAFISDRYGRTIVLTLNTTGLVLMWISIVGVGWFKDLFPVELIALAPLFTILGGECVFMSTVSSVIADLAPEQKLRTHLFSYTASVGYVTILAGPGLAAFMMSFNLWVPFSVGIALLLASYPLIAMLPGGGCLSPSEDAIDEQTALLPTNESSEDASIHTRSTTSDASFVTATYSYMTGLFRPITQNPKFLLLTSVFFLAGFASSNSPLLVQYISKRYGWTFSQAGYLLSAKAIVNVLLLTIIIPSLIQYINAHLAISPRDINIGAAELSLIISVIGVLTIALAQNMGSLIPGLIIYALGSALPVFTMSLVKSEGTSASDNTIARDYSTVELAKRLGFLFGVPFMTYVWAKGIGSGGIALGLPYFTSAVFYSVAIVSVWALRK